MQGRHECASAYCPFSAPRVCRECPAVDTVCDTDAAGDCICNLTVQGQKDCHKTTPETPATKCDECPDGTTCVATDFDFVNCFKRCGAA